MAILAIDFGTRRLGIAIADSSNSHAYPLGSLRRRSPYKDLEQLRIWADGREVSTVVVGLPLNMDGSEGAMARAARKFGAELAAYLDLPVDYADERLSSFEARERLSEHGGMRRKKHAVDAVAAAVILDDWLAKHSNSS